MEFKPVKECSECSEDTTVVDSRIDIYSGVVIRRRECMGCGKRFNTYEIHADDCKELLSFGDLSGKLIPDIDTVIAMLTDFKNKVKNEDNNRR